MLYLEGIEPFDVQSLNSYGLKDLILKVKTTSLQNRSEYTTYRPSSAIGISTAFTALKVLIKIGFVTTMMPLWTQSQ